MAAFLPPPLPQEESTPNLETGLPQKAYLDKREWHCWLERKARQNLRDLGWINLHSWSRHARCTNCHIRPYVGCTFSLYQLPRDLGIFCSFCAATKL